MWVRVGLVTAQTDAVAVHRRSNGLEWWGPKVRVLILCSKLRSRSTCRSSLQICWTHVFRTNNGIKSTHSPTRQRWVSMSYWNWGLCQAVRKGDPGLLSRYHTGTHLTSHKLVQEFIRTQLAAPVHQPAVPWKLQSMMQTGVTLPGIGHLIVTTNKKPW